MTVGVEEERRGRAGAVDGAKEMDDDDEVWVEPTANEVTVLLVVVGTLLRWRLARLAAEGGGRAGATDDGAPECTPLMRDITIGGPLLMLVLPALTNTRTHKREDQAHEGIRFGAQDVVPASRRCRGHERHRGSW
jgi:hypothetical protein